MRTFVCHWCDGTEHKRSPLLWDATRETFVHGVCAQRDAKLHRVSSITTREGTRVEGAALTGLAAQQPAIRSWVVGAAL